MLELVEKSTDLVRFRFIKVVNDLRSCRLARAAFMPYAYGFYMPSSSRFILKLNENRSSKVSH